jgi:hypothetical protein
MLNYIPTPVSEVKIYGVFVRFIVFLGVGVPFGWDSMVWFLVVLSKIYVG